MKERPPLTLVRACGDPVCESCGFPAFVSERKPRRCAACAWERRGRAFSRNVHELPAVPLVARAHWRDFGHVDYRVIDGRVLLCEHCGVLFGRVDDLLDLGLASSAQIDARRQVARVLPSLADVISRLDGLDDEMRKVSAILAACTRKG